MKVGALLVREWNGRLERVMILEEGFAWNGQTFGSLSQIAKAMTGTNWNGIFCGDERCRQRGSSGGRPSTHQSRGEFSSAVSTTRERAMQRFRSLKTLQKINAVHVEVYHLVI